MEDELQVNTKLYGYEGIIGRYDFFRNIILIGSIALLFTLPYQLWMLSNMQTFTDVFNMNAMFAQAPILLKIWFSTGILGTFVLLASNLYRRLNDINGKINNYINIPVILLCLLSQLCLVLPFKYYFISGISLIINLIILFTKGKITGTYPYDYTKEFNWGAFIGTWLWGLFNKSYKTLWILLIGLTPWGIYYQIYCGIKGNEWAFKNKKWDDVNAFNKSQEKQSVIFLILSAVVIPIIFTLVIFGAVAGLIYATDKNPQQLEQSMTKLENIIYDFGSSYFESYVIATDENKFYISSSDWNKYSFNDKVDILDAAATLAAMEKDKEYKKTHPNSCSQYSKSKELPRTKIYSSTTNRLLGEFYIDSNMEGKDFMEVIKAGMNAYRFYNDK